MTRYSDDLATPVGMPVPAAEHDQPARRSGRPRRQDPAPHGGDGEIPARHLFPERRRGRRQYPGEDRIMVPSPKVATYDLQPEMSAPELDRPGGRGDRIGQIRPDRAELRQSRHGRPHRQPAGRDQGGGDGRCRPRPHRRGDRRQRRRAAGHRRSRQLRTDERPGNRRPAHRPHHQPGARSCSPASPGAQLHDGRLADIAPTLLHLLRPAAAGGDDGAAADGGAGA